MFNWDLEQKYVKAYLIFVKQFQEVTFKTYDGTPDKSLGKKFTVTPLSWNGVTQAGTVRVVNFQVTHDLKDTETTLVSLNLNGNKEIK